MKFSIVTEFEVVIGMCLPSRNLPLSLPLLLLTVAFEKHHATFMKRAFHRKVMSHVFRAPPSIRYHLWSANCPAFPSFPLGPSHTDLHKRHGSSSTNYFPQRRITLRFSFVRSLAARSLLRSRTSRSFPHLAIRIPNRALPLPGANVNTRELLLEVLRGRGEGGREERPFSGLLFIASLSNDYRRRTCAV